MLNYEIKNYKPKNIWFLGMFLAKNGHRDKEKNAYIYRTKIDLILGFINLCSKKDKSKVKKQKIYDKEIWIINKFNLII